VIQKPATVCTLENLHTTESEFVNVYGAQESIPWNRFHGSSNVSKFGLKEARRSSPNDGKEKLVQKYYAAFGTKFRIRIFKEPSRKFYLIFSLKSHPINFFNHFCMRTENTALF
jgi:hypothetical protein